MKHCGDTQTLGKGNEEFNQFEEELVQRHRAQMVEELRGKLEGMDRVAAEELLKTGHFVDKGSVRRKFQTSVGGGMGEDQAVEAQRKTRESVCIV